MTKLSIGAFLVAMLKSIIYLTNSGPPPPGGAPPGWQKKKKKILFSYTHNSAILKIYF